MTRPIQYRIQPIDPDAHLFEIECRISAPASDGQRLSLPAWIPGSYMIRDFARHIVSIEAYSDDGPVALNKQDKASWLSAPVSGPLTLRYQVYAWDLSVRGAHLDRTHGFFNGTSVFLRVAGHEHRPHEVDILAPAGEAYRHWRVATSLDRVGGAKWSFGRYQAPDYDALIDHPVEMGDFSLAEFDACGVPHAIAITGRHQADMERLCRDLSTICEHHIRLFGEPAPIDRYLFLVIAVGDGYGGLEHRNSTALLCKRDDLPLAHHDSVDEVSDGYRQFLGLCSHEYFHTWNIKRIKPAVFSPYSLDRESYTRQLWAFEGITSYYDDLGLVRCGLITPRSYLELFGTTVTRIIRGPGRLRQSVAESSFDAWTKFYRQDENAANAIVSYYGKGAMIAMALDLLLRKATDGRTSLDDLMRLLWQRYGRTGIGVPEGAIEQHAMELAGESAGKSLAKLFADCLYGTQDPPLQDLLTDIGIAYRLRPALDSSDSGGKPAPDDAPKALGKRVSLGLRLSRSDAEAKVAVVLDGGAAQQAGIAAGDQLIALNGLRIDCNGLDQTLRRHRPGDPIHIHAFRRDELMEFHPVLQPAPLDTCYLQLQEQADADTLARRKAWLSN